MSVICVAFDVECTGQSLTRHAMIEIGAVAIDTSTCAPLSKFSIELKMPQGRTWEQRCLDEFWDNRDWENLPENTPEEKLKKQEKRENYESLQSKRKRVADGLGEEPEVAMERFTKWLREEVRGKLAGGDRLRVILASDTVSFDSSWINVYLDLYANEPPLDLFFDNKFCDVICTSDIARGLSVVSHDEYLKIKRAKGRYSRDETCRFKLGIPESVQPAAKHNHTAVCDAQYIGEEHCIQMLFAAKHPYAGMLEKINI
jgi:hypothetical protein